MLGSKFSFGTITIIVSLFSIGGMVLWWIIRKKVKRVWLPTVKILNLPKKSLPKLTRITPPLIPFLCFLATALALLLFTLEPQKVVQIESNNKQQNHHILIDLSPSHSAYASLDEIRKSVRSIYQSLNESVTFSLSSTLSNEVTDITSDADLDTFLSSLKFHPAGVRLGQLIRDRFTTIDEMDRIYIVSDEDFHSWSDLQWEYLTDKVDIYRVQAGQSGNKQNIFINNVYNVSESLSEKVEWEVELSRSQNGNTTKGTIEVKREGKVLAKELFTFPDKENQIRIKISWFEKTNSVSKSKLTFSILPDESDAISLDNSFLVESKSSATRALFITDQGGELQLEDPAHHLIGSFEVLGFQIDRLDHLPSEDLDLSSYSIVVIGAGTGNGLRDYCPTASLRKFKSLTASPPKVWIYPISQNANYNEMCHCLALLKDNSTSEMFPPDYCSESNSRSSWSFLLKSIGGKAVGGEIDMQEASVAWLLRNQPLDLELLAFTMPLNPRIGRGFGFAQFPLLAKALLSWQSLILDGRTQSKGWMRIEDISLAYEQNYMESNTPYGESILRLMSRDQLPPIWQNSKGDDFKTSFVRKQAYTPEPWIRAIFLLTLSMILFELFFSVVRALRLRSKNQGSEQILILLILIPLAWAGSSEAQVTINAVGYSGVQSSSHLAFEISSRTSIELKPKLTLQPELTKKSLSDPWLWSRNLNSVVDSKNKFHIEIVNWIKNGGYLVIEDTTDITRLKQAIEGHFSHHAFTPEWKPIPPDHEIMRSFYLLDSLPQCQGKSWQGFIFDERLAILVVPFRFLESLTDKTISLNCKEPLSREQLVRTFVNIMMVALATDYKKDQIHLPEILKRLR